MNLPKGYEWLGDVGVLPKTIQGALALYGTLETPGSGNNKDIIKWAKELGLQNVYSDDSIPWCGLFAAIVAHRASKAVVKDPLWARNWGKFGLEVAVREKTGLKFTASREASLGDVLVYERGNGGHVNFYIAETDTHFIGIGGNQSDSVSIISTPKERCIAIRRPHYTNPPESMRPYHLAHAGSAPTGGSEA